MVASFCFSATAHAIIAVLDTPQWRLGIGGFVELDAFHDSVRGTGSAGGNLTEIIGNSPITAPGSPSGNGSGDHGQTQMSGRNSRLNLTITPPEVDGWKSKGYFEADFLGYEPAPNQYLAYDAANNKYTNANTESSFFSNATLRMRQAFLSVEKDGLQFLAGQAWSLFGFQPTYVLNTISVAPVSGELFQRIGQIAVLKKRVFGSDTIEAGFSLERPGQRDSQVPNIDLGVRYLFGGRKAVSHRMYSDVGIEAMSIGVSGTLRQIVAPGAKPGDDMISKSTGGFALDAMIPIIPNDQVGSGHSLALIGEFTTGHGYADAMPNWSGVGQLVPSANPANPNLDPGLGAVQGGNLILAELRSWNLWIQYHFPAKMPLFAHVGVSRFKSDNAGSLGGSYDQSTTMFANLNVDVSKPVRVGLEFARFQTHATNGNIFFDDRVQGAVWFRF